ncbi:hypothetical protein [Ancylobacter sp.]|uniref:hypothetical protein n=1 Tax=Ancylobacter sp. TaxID=1872567 RepID=UPI003D1418FE
MIVFMRQARRVEPSDAVFADSILPESGDYLDSRWMSRLISGELSEDVYIQEIMRQKKFFSRLRRLYPHFLEFFNVPEDERIFNHAMCVSDCFNDSNLTEGREREDKLNGLLIKKIDSIINKSSSLIRDIDYIEKNIDIDLSDILIQESIVNADHPNYWLFSHCNTKDAIERIPDFFRIHRSAFLRKHSQLRNNIRSLRASIVEYAYKMADFWDGPPLLTTPGSSFSNMCSILFEIITGKKDSSLAGTINRFARSDSRRQWDNERTEEYEHEELQIKDNFYHKRKNTLKLRKICRFYLDQASFNDIQEGAQRLALDIARIYIRELEKNLTELGPHPLPIFVPAEADPEWWDKFQAEVAGRKALEREVGELRRAMRLTGNHD